MVESLPRRGDAFLVGLDPTVGRETKKARPCVILSPDELNDHLSTFLVAPLTTGGHPYPFRIPCRFERKDGCIVLDQLRTVDRRRLRKHLGTVSPSTLSKALGVLQEMFTE